MWENRIETHIRAAVKTLGRTKGRKPKDEDRHGDEMRKSKMPLKARSWLTKYGNVQKQIKGESSITR